MSKKIMKRSLALGALMAFVITGSAMAAEKNIQLNGTSITLDNQTNKYIQSGYNSNQSNPITLKGIGVETVTSKGISEQCAVASYSTGEITIDNVKEIVVNGSWRSNDAYNNYAGNVFYAQGVNSNVAKVNISLLNGTIKSDGVLDNAIVFHATGGGNIDVVANAIDVKTTYTAVMAQEKGKVNITTQNDLLIEGKGSLNTGGSNASIVVNGKNVTLNASDATAGINLRGDSNNNVDVTAKENISITGSSAVNINTTTNTGNKVSLNAKNISIIDDGSYSSGYALRVKNGTIDINASVKTDICGDIAAQGVGRVEVDFGTNGSLVGAVTTESGSTTYLDLGTNSIWNAFGTGVNNVTELNGTGTVIVGEGDSVEAGGNAVLTVRASGDLAEDIAGITDNTKQAEELGKVAEQVTGITVKQVGTTEGEIAGAITAELGEDGQVVAGSVKEAVNTVNKAIGEASVVGMAHIRAHMNDMNKRMGELRMANGEAGVWTRMVRGEEEFAGAKSQYNQYQLGYDEKLSVDKRWTVGAAVTFAEGNGNFANGSTENDSTAFAIYGSKLNNDGTFVDLIARYARFESDITVADAKSDYSTNGMSVSAEFGKRIQQGKGFWIEPQVELTYGSVDSAEYTINGKDVTVGDMDSLIGRVGFSLGKDIKQGNVYARASYLYDFDGETDTTFGKNGVTRTIEEDLGGGWWEVGVGANISLSKATYIYADIEKTFGGEIDTNWQWNLGVRYSF